MWSPKRLVHGGDRMLQVAWIASGAWWSSASHGCLTFPWVGIGWWRVTGKSQYSITESSTKHREIVDCDAWVMKGGDCVTCWYLSSSPMLWTLCICINKGNTVKIMHTVQLGGAGEGRWAPQGVEPWAIVSAPPRPPTLRTWRKCYIRMFIIKYYIHNQHGATVSILVQ